MSNVRIPVKVPLVTQPLSFLQTLRTMRRNVLEILPQLSVEQPMVSGKIAMVSWHMVNDPQALQRVMADKVTNYPKSVVMNDVLTLGLGHSLFTAEGKNWRWQRRAASPAFSHRNVQHRLIEHTPMATLLHLCNAIPHAIHHMLFKLEMRQVHKNPRVTSANP